MSVNKLKKNTRKILKPCGCFKLYFNYFNFDLSGKGGIAGNSSG